MTRAPAAEAPMHALIAECSDSTVTYSVWTRPCATNFANSSTIVVCGVIGIGGHDVGRALAHRLGDEDVAGGGDGLLLGHRYFTSGSSQPSGTI